MLGAQLVFPSLILSFAHAGIYRLVQWSISNNNPIPKEYKRNLGGLVNAIHCKVDQAVCGMLYVCLVTFPDIGKCWLLRIFDSRKVTPSTVRSLLFALVTTTHQNTAINTKSVSKWRVILWEEMFNLTQ